MGCRCAIGHGRVGYATLGCGAKCGPLDLHMTAFGVLSKENAVTGAKDAHCGGGLAVGISNGVATIPSIAGGVVEATAWPLNPTMCVNPRPDPYDAAVLGDW